VSNKFKMVFPMSHVAPNEPAWNGAIVVAPVKKDGTVQEGVVCWNDGEPFKGKPVQLPSRALGDNTSRFTGNSCFCSWECGMCWAQRHMTDWEYRTMRTKVFEVTGKFVQPANDPFLTLAKYTGPGGMDIDTYRKGTEGMEATNASTTVVPGHTVTFWTATVAPPTGPRITNTAPQSGISALLATTTPASTPQKMGSTTSATSATFSTTTPQGAGGGGAAPATPTPASGASSRSATKSSGYRRARPRTEPTVANTLLQYATPSK
jgi:hypothetical protein